MAARRNGHSKALTAMGILWLLLSATLLVYQLLNPAAIEIQWETVSEVETAGFHLYRSESPQGGFVLLNEEPIPSQGNAATGSRYTYLDAGVIAGRTYYYLLEEVEYDLAARRYQNEKFTHTVPFLSTWASLLAALSLAGGFALLGLGLKESRDP